jgi:aldose 1-epimerase
MSIHKKEFGVFEKNPVELYTISNDYISASFMNVGATITNISVLDCNKNHKNICLGFDSLQEYITYAQYYIGVTCGRYANRIGDAKFTIHNATYKVSNNLGNHHLHGGAEGFNLKYWEAAIIDDNKIAFTYISKDGEEGYPGNVSITVTYTLLAQALHITFEATTDKATPINLTNHAYFNLSGERNIKNHELQIMSTQLMQVNNDAIPNGSFMNVANTLYDFTKQTLLAKYYEHNDVYDNTWLLSIPFGILQKAAIVYSDLSKISLHCSTSFPSIHFYDGTFLDHPFHKNQGLCLEAQFLPDSPNQPHFPKTIIYPNQNWKYETVYEFKTNFV